MKKVIVCLLLLTILSGCFDRTEVEEKAYVIALGLDLPEDKESNQFDISMQIANPESSSIALGGGQSSEPPKETVTIRANDLIAARSTANTVVSRQLTFDHTNILVVSEELARSKKFINVIQAASRDRQLRRGLQIVVSKERASEFLRNNNPTTETRPHKYFRFIMEDAAQQGFIPDADLHRFFQITEGDADLFLAAYATATPEQGNKNGLEDEYVAGEVPIQAGSKTQFIGSAVFKEGQMIDTLTGEETRLAILLDNTQKYVFGLGTYKDPKSEEFRITARFMPLDSAEIKIELDKNNQATINVDVPFNLELLAVPSLINYFTNQKNKELLKKTIEESLEKKSEELVKKTQEVYGAEPFYWSLYVRKYFKTIKEYEKADWNKKIYPHAKVNINYSLNQLTYGKLIKNSNLNEIRD
ncbi:Ger(x)C family spore germination protein [Bacillaceae bacterium S4-13-56]